MPRETVTFVYVTFIASTPQKVYDAIVRPEIAKLYWAHENVSDWKPGSRWDHVNRNGQSDVCGTVVEATPPSRLVLSWSATSEFSDAAKHSRVVMEVVPYEGMVKLVVTHSELEAGSAMATGVTKGWPIVLSSLKTYLETGRPLDVYAKPVDNAA